MANADALDVQQDSTAGQPSLTGEQSPSASSYSKLSGSLVSPAIVHQRSRGRGGDRLPDGSTASIPSPSVPTAAPLTTLPGGAPPPDPNNPYMIRYGDFPVGMMHPAMHIPPNPYLPPPPPGSYPVM